MWREVLFEATHFTTSSSFHDHKDKLVIFIPLLPSNRSRDHSLTTIPLSITIPTQRTRALADQDENNPTKHTAGQKMSSSKSSVAAGANNSSPAMPDSSTAPRNASTLSAKTHLEIYKYAIPQPHGELEAEDIVGVGERFCEVLSDDTIPSDTVKKAFRLLMGRLETERRVCKMKTVAEMRSQLELKDAEIRELRAEQSPSSAVLNLMNQLDALEQAHHQRERLWEMKEELRDKVMADLKAENAKLRQQQEKVIEKLQATMQSSNANGNEEQLIKLLRNEDEPPTAEQIQTQQAHTAAQKKTTSNSEKKRASTQLDQPPSKLPRP